MRIRKYNDFFLALLLLLGAGFFYCQTWFIREVMSFSMGPLIFPRVILALIALLSLAVMAQSVDFSGAAAGRPEAPSRLSFCPERAATIGLLIAYVLVLPHLGYRTATIAFLILCMLLLGKRTPAAAAGYAALSAGVALSLEYVFGRLLQLFLP